MIMKTIVILACGALIAPVAFGQTRSTHKRQTTTAIEQPITVTGTIIKMTTGEGSAASYQPFKTLVVREDRSNTPGSYVLNGPGRVVNKLSIKPARPEISPIRSRTISGESCGFFGGDEARCRADSCHPCVLSCL